MINLKIRLKNPVFYMQLIIAVATPVFAYTGITASEINSWTKLGEIIIQAISNPYIIFLIMSSLYNAVIDPTTRGLSDSKRAVSYKSPGE